jgi:DNA-binding Xre family transcriptional regulator
MMKFRLKELLERPGAPSQAELARRLGVPRQQVNRLVNGDIERVDLKTLDRLYEALGCTSVDDLISYRPPRQQTPTFRERFIGELAPRRPRSC